jgi:branched-chain amino acid transport system substrate-binding protein
MHAKIGFAAPLTGEQAIVGIPMRQCAELAVEEASKANDLPCSVELWAEDDLASPSQSREVARRFVDDPSVVGVVGHKNSGPSGVAAPIYAEAGLTQITPSSTYTELSRRGYATFFRLCASDRAQGVMAARYAVRCLGASRIVVVHDRTEYGRPLAEIARDTLTREEAEIVAFEGVSVGVTRFPELVSLIQKESPDLVYLALTEIESSNLAVQLRAAGVRSSLFGTDGSRESKFATLAQGAAEGSYHSYAGADPQTTSTGRRFVQLFQTRYGHLPVYGAEVYDGVNLLIAALRRAGTTDRRRVLAAVASNQEFKGVTGTVKFEADGERQDAGVTIWQVRQGQNQLLGLARDLISKS